MRRFRLLFARGIGALAAMALLLQDMLPATAAAQQPVTITYYTFSAAPDHLGDLNQARRVRSHSSRHQY